MAILVDQPTQNPSNKLSAAIIAGAIVAVSRALIAKYVPELDNDTVWIALTPIVIWGCGYFVRDRATTAIVVGEQK